MDPKSLPDTQYLERLIVERTEAGQHPEATLAELIATGLSCDEATDLMVTELEKRLGVLQTNAQRNVAATQDDSVEALRKLTVPNPRRTRTDNLFRVIDRDVRILGEHRAPHVLFVGNLLSATECDQLIALSRQNMRASTVIDMDSGGEKFSGDRSSTGAALTRLGLPLIARIERRLAEFAQWPIEHGEALQILRYGPGQEYKPHYDYVDPTQPGAQPFLARGGQRVASIVMYLNTPQAGGGTAFPDFSYECAHPSSRTLHAGSPVLKGEKWVATKWLREGEHH
ncbi:MAG: 2-oxoglutarate-dependent dioxygenase [Gammaproteobacteria bacterium]|nr:2-oxoglutarate-dependent dioxygenase [Gammaproteobacteria bacterium]